MSVPEFDNMFDSWFNPDNRDFIINIMNFKTIIKNNGLVRSSNSVNLIELFDKNVIAMEHCFKILKALKVIKTEVVNDKTVHVLDIAKQFNTIDMTPLVTEYSGINSKALNQLFSDEYLRTVRDGKHIEFSTRTMKAIIDKMLKEYFGYQTVKVGSFMNYVNGNRNKITEYMISPVNSPKCLFSFLS